MEIELLGREIGEVEFEGRFKVFEKSLNGRLTGRISKMGKARYELEIEGPAIVDFGSLTVNTSVDVVDAGAPVPEPSSAVLYLVGLAALRRGVNPRKTG